MKTKIKSHGDEATDLYGTCLAVISLGKALKKDENFYP